MMMLISLAVSISLSMGTRSSLEPSPQVRVVITNHTPYCREMVFMSYDDEDRQQVHIIITPECPMCFDVDDDDDTDLEDFALFQRQMSGPKYSRQPQKDRVWVEIKK